MPLKPLAVPVCVALTLLAACASDEAAGKRRKPGDPPISFEQFDNADTDHDGKLNREEFKAVMPQFEARFGRIDTDRSGFLSWSEIRAGRFPLMLPPNDPRL